MALRRGREDRQGGGWRESWRFAFDWMMRKEWDYEQVEKVRFRTRESPEIAMV